MEIPSGRVLSSCILESQVSLASLKSECKLQCKKRGSYAYRRATREESGKRDSDHELPIAKWLQEKQKTLPCKIQMRQNLRCCMQPKTSEAAEKDESSLKKPSYIAEGRNSGSGTTGEGHVVK